MERIYLLGGMDLEMNEIAKLLDYAGQCYYSKNLEWHNAHLSAYSDILAEHPHSQFVGVELSDPERLASRYNYTLVDHHNQYSDRPSSLLQVASMLGLAVTDRMRIVAANDIGAIAGMLDAGFSYTQAMLVRTEDRRAQGITPEQEQLCQKALLNKVEYLDAVVVKSPIRKFSYITDMLYPSNRIMVYTDAALTYYGPGRAVLLSSYEGLIASGAAYYGGAGNGFFGLAEGFFTQSDIEYHVNNILKLTYQIV